MFNTPERAVCVSSVFWQRPSFSKLVGTWHSVLRCSADKKNSPDRDVFSAVPFLCPSLYIILFSVAGALAFSAPVRYTYEHSVMKSLLRPRRIPVKHPALSCILVFFLAQSAVAADRTPSTEVSTSDDQSSVAITIYNSNIGLVKDQRNIRMDKGLSELRFMDIASQIMPATVHIKSLSNPNGLTILEQNYEYDLLNPQKLLDKYVGKEVSLYQKNPYTDKEEVVRAKLLSNNNGPIYQIGNQITFGHPGRVLFPEVPANLISRPTLVWLLNNTSSSKQNIEATYLTNGITWRADYVVTLSAQDDRADLAGWVTIDNRSGGEYRNAVLKLVAGDINRVEDEVPLKKAGRLTLAQAAAPQFQEESLFEYHLYSLQRPSTIKDNQIKQISFITAENIPVRKEFVFKGQTSYYWNQLPEPLRNQKIGVYVEIENKKGNHLGMPLPKGIIRAYKKDSAGSLQFVGEDRIDHTPKNEKVRIKLGDAFDVVATRKQTDWKKSAKNITEASYEISLRNHKKEAVEIRVIEPVPGDWSMLSSSHEYKKTSSRTAEFVIPVPADKEVILTYAVRMKY